MEDRHEIGSRDRDPAGLPARYHGHAGPCRRPADETRTIDVSFARPDLSARRGFTVTQRLAGVIGYTIFTDAQRNMTRVLEHFQLDSSLSANGHTLVVTNANAPLRVVFNADGSTTVYYMGTSDFTTAPGQGAIHRSAGLTIHTLTVSGPATVEAHGLQITSESGFCAALAP